MAGKKELSRDDQKKTLVKVMKYIKKYRMLVVLSLIFAAVTVVTTLYLPILTGNAVDLMVKKGKVDFVGLKTDREDDADRSCDHRSRAVDHEYL